jgi:nicotinamide riboside kinase
LAQSLVAALNRPTDPWLFAPEALRAWCNEHQRTPLAVEQISIARAQADSVMAIQRSGASAIADTTPLMTAIYSDVLFQDTSLYAFALEHHCSYDLTLFAAPDLPWEADGLQRDGKQARTKISEKLREVLALNGLAHTVVCGDGQARTQSALDAIAHQCRKPIASSVHDTVWKWSCDTCADADCEHRIFNKLL